YFFAASDDFAADKAKSIVPLGRGGPTPYAAERSGVTSAVRDVLAAPFETAPRAPMRPREREVSGQVSTRDSSFPGPPDRAVVGPNDATVKGAIIMGALEHIDAAHGPRTGAQLLSRLDAAHRGKLEGMVLPMAWFPLTLLEQLVRVTDEAVGRG